MVSRLPKQVQTTAGIPNGLRAATVASVVAGGVMIKINGATLGPYAWISPYTPLVGDVVSVFRQDSSWVVLGPLVTRQPGYGQIGPVGGNGATSASTTPVAVTSAASITFARAGAPLLIQQQAGAFVSVANTGVDFGVRIFGTGYDVTTWVAAQFFNPINQHMSAGGTATITTPGVGAYSFQAMMWRFSGTGTATSDVNDAHSVTLQEQP